MSAPAEASANLARYDGVRFGHRCDNPADLMDLYARSRSEGFGSEVQRRILVGTYALSAGFYDAYFKKAQQVRRIISNDFKKAFEHCDIIAGPAAPDVAFPIGAKNDDPIAMYLNDVFTVPASMAGLPAISVPAGLDASGLPMGLHLIGRAFDEVMAAAREIPEVVEIQTFLGRVDLRLSVLARDMTHYQEVYRDRILALPHITDIEALMQVATLKDARTLPI